MTASSRYPAEYGRWEQAPEAYWAAAAEAILWRRRYDSVFDPASGPYGRWFPGGSLNTCENCLDRHVDGGRGDHTALIWESPASGQSGTWSFAALRDRVARVAGALSRLGVARGDRVVVYMPMVPEAVIVMLACARLGAVHSVVFGGFAAPELAKRIDDAGPVVVVSASCGIEPGRLVAYKPLLDAALGLASHQPRACLVLQRPMLTAAMQLGRDHDFAEAEAAATPHEPVPVAATDPLYILYTSGTTGRPKGVVRDNGGHAVALHHSMALLYGLGRDDVMFTASDIGWVVGHSYIVYAPLLAGLATVLYEGKPVGTPDPAAFWRVCAAHHVSVLFTAPTAIRAIRQQDPQAALAGDHDLLRLQAIFLAGERCDPPTAAWLLDRLGKPVIDHWWQTETGWAITGNFRGLGLLPTKPGSGGRPSPGHRVAAVDQAGHPAAPGDIGHLVLRLPLPPGCAPSLWGDDGRFAATYLAEFPGWYRSGDAGHVDADGEVFVMGRTDDVINVAGHRLSTGELEQVLAGHPDVAECAVIGVADSLKGQVPLGLVVLKAGAARDEPTLAAELVQRVREQIGPVAAFKDVRVVGRLPKTRSGKILRATIRALVDGERPATPPTIEDASVLQEIARLLHKELP